jgi:hypothetical protein
MTWPWALFSALFTIGIFYYFDLGLTCYELTVLLHRPVLSALFSACYYGLTCSALFGPGLACYDTACFIFDPRPGPGPHCCFAVILTLLTLGPCFQAWALFGMLPALLQALAYFCFRRSTGPVSALLAYLQFSLRYLDLTLV